MTSTDSGIWSENGTHKSADSTDINHNKSGVKGHYRDNSFGGSSGYGSVSSQTGGARPKLSEVNGQNIPKVELMYRGYLFYSLKDRNLFHRVDTIGNIFTLENITDGVHEMK